MKRGESVITIDLLPHEEKLARTNPYPTLKHYPLHHQIRTVEALKHYDIVMNTYNTGTGKTVASLLHLFAINGEKKDVLFIAPTNALLEQHAEDIQDFVDENNLNFAVRHVTASKLREIDPAQRSGKTLYTLIRNHLDYDDTKRKVRQPLILVVNPDIFYYAMFIQYNKLDELNLMTVFSGFDYIVVDEFHYYNNKQLCNFLFVFTLFDQMGYFDDPKHKRKVCLLSATPSPHVRQYLDKLFSNRWKLIAPNNESKDSNNLMATPSLSPLKVQLLAVNLSDWVIENGEVIKEWVDDGLDGAVISSSLGAINKSHYKLRHLFDDDLMNNNRITGPESNKSRHRATSQPLIFASPTVDIGYNFKKEGKTRQNVDFLICDARFQDGLLQRIGRAGRVLGKPIQNSPSHVICLISSRAVASLKHLDGKIMDRRSFNECINECHTLPVKHNLTRYIDTYSVVECFYPIYRLLGTTSEEYHSELEQLYERIRDAFAPNGDFDYEELRRSYRTYHKRKKWYRKSSETKIPNNETTVCQIIDMIFWGNRSKKKKDIQAMIPDVRQSLPSIVDDAVTRKSIRQFVRGQIALIESLFSFRDSFQGSDAVIYDPLKLLSREMYNKHDLFHLLRLYNVGFLDEKQFQMKHPKNDLSGPFYLEILGWRDESLVLDYGLEVTVRKPLFEKWCYRLVGISGIKIQLREQRGSVQKSGLLPPEVVDAISEQTIVALIIPPYHANVAKDVLGGSSVWSSNLVINFSSEDKTEKYIMYLGDSAYFAHSELPNHWSFKNIKSVFDAPSIIPNNV